MRKTIFIFFAFIATIIFISCDVATPKIIEEEVSEKTSELRKKYKDKLIGSWYFKRENKKRKAFEAYTFEKDGTMTGILKYMKRDSVIIGGKPMLTDWSFVIDDTIKGKWELYYSGDMEMNILSINANVVSSQKEKIIPFHTNFQFIDVNESTLHIAGLFTSGMGEFKRGTVNSGF